MNVLVLLPIAWATAFLINLVPAFMPPTWAVLAVFHITSDVPLLPLTIGGAAASAGGRYLLALGTRQLDQFLPDGDRRNAEALGGFLCRHSRWSVVIVFLGCLGPLPSNALFIACGLGRVRLSPIVVAFFLSRAIADSLWVWSAGPSALGPEASLRTR